MNFDGLHVAEQSVLNLRLQLFAEQERVRIQFGNLGAWFLVELAVTVDFD